MKRYLIELIGTFFLTYAITSGNPLTAGFVLVGLLFIAGHVSGGHFNPAISVGVWARRFFHFSEFDLKDLIFYVVAQFIGALLAVGLYLQVIGVPFDPVPFLGLPVWFALLMEFLLTVLFVWVVITTTRSGFYKNTPSFAFAIGLVLSALLFIGLGVYNPAIAAASGVFKVVTEGAAAVSPKVIAIYYLAPLVSGFVAAAAAHHFGTDR